MNYILTFKLFEAAKSVHPDYNEFEIELEKFPLREVFKDWFKISPVRTGRVNISATTLPSKTYFWKDERGWNYRFEGSGRRYGDQNGSLQDLFLNLMKDAIIKIPYNRLSKKELDLGLSEDQWLLDNITLGDKQRNVEEKILRKIYPDIIYDFQKLEFPKLKILQNLGFGRIIPVGSEYPPPPGGIFFEFDDLSTGSSPTLFSSIADSILRSYDTIVVRSGGGEGPMMYFTWGKEHWRGIKFLPKGDGIKKVDRSEYLIGLKTNQEVVQAIEKIVLGALSSIKVEFFGSYVRQEAKNKIESFFSLISEILQSDDSEQNLAKIESEILFDYFKKNPLDMWMLDEFPDGQKIKQTILSKTGKKDLSSIGKTLKLKLY